jgi:hypothetical protein
MSRPIAYNKPGAAINGSITNEDAVISYVVDGRGNDYYNNYETCKWVPSADGAAPIVFVTDTFTRGYEGDPNLAVPLFFACAGTSSAAILYTANRLPGSPGNYSNANTALDELNRIYGYFILESNDPFEGINATSLALDLDASKMTSYPQTGTNVYDLSGNGGSGVLNNGVSWNATSGSFFFDGTDDDIYVNNYSAINMVGTQPYTAMATVYPLLGGTTWHGIFSKGNSQQYALTINSPSAFLHYESNQSAYGALNSAGGSVDVNRWQHFVARFDGNEKTIWKNGEIIATQATPGLSNGNNIEELRIGEGNTGEQLRGEITSVQVYRRSLSTAEIKQNYFGAPIVTDGLVFAVDANNIVSYPKSGTAWYNLTGSVGTGTLTNGPTFNLNNGGSIVFDGADDYVNVPNGMNALVGTNQVTFSAWIRRSSTTGYWAGIISNKINATDGIALLVNPTSKIFFQYDSTSGVYAIDGGATLETNVWYNIVGIYDNVGLKTYLNGVLNDSAADAGKSIASSGNMDIVIGAHQPISSYFPGEIANVKIYNRGLTASEVLQNYQAEQYRFETPAGPVTNGLVLYLDAGNLDSYPGTGTTWYTLAGSNNGTLNNGVGYNQTNGGVLIFDGVDDYATAGNFFTYQAFTINLWIRPGSSQTTYADIIDNNHTGTQNWVLQQNVANLNQYEFAVFGSAGQTSLSGLFTLTSNTWVNLTFTYDGDKVRGYNNGTLFATGASLGTTINYVAPTFNIGNWNLGGRNWNGQYSVVQSYNRALSSTEITQNYNFFKGRFGL